jgi:hypothetical protein
MRRTRKTLAASFVVTFAAGCDSRSAQPPATPTVDVGSVPAAASATKADMTDAGSTSTSASGTDASAVAALPPAPTVGRVQRAADGTCMWYPSLPPSRMANGRRVTLNPPPPHRVQCPPDDAGTSGEGGP